MQPGDLSIILPEIILSVFAMGALLAGVYGGKDDTAPIMVWTTSAMLLALALWIGAQGEGTARALDFTPAGQSPGVHGAYCL